MAAKPVLVAAMGGETTKREGFLVAIDAAGIATLDGATFPMGSGEVDAELANTFLLNPPLLSQRRIRMWLDRLAPFLAVRGVMATGMELGLNGFDFALAPDGSRVLTIEQRIEQPPPDAPARESTQRPVLTLQIARNLVSIYRSDSAHSWVDGGPSPQRSDVVHALLKQDRTNYPNSALITLQVADDVTTEEWLPLLGISRALGLEYTYLARFTPPMPASVAVPEPPRSVIAPESVSATNLGATNYTMAGMGSTMLPTAVHYWFEACEPDICSLVAVLNNRSLSLFTRPPASPDRQLSSFLGRPLYRWPEGAPLPPRGAAAAPPAMPSVLGTDPDWSGYPPGTLVMLPALERFQIKEGIQTQMPQIEECYSNALNDDPEFAGNLAIRFVIGPAGTTTEATAPRWTGPENPPFISCVLAAFYRATFPKPKGGGQVVITFPFVFAPQEAE